MCGVKSVPPAWRTRSQTQAGRLYETVPAAMIDEEEPAEAAQDDATVPLRDEDDRTAPLEISYLGTKLAMAIYVTLVNFTDQGVRNVKDSQPADAA